MREQRGKQAAASFLFKLAESVGTQGISFVVSVVLARLLDPSDYGVLTMLTVFIAVSQVFVQSGLNTALIQKKDVDETDLSSVFYVSLGIAVVLYGLLFLLAVSRYARRLPRASERLAEEKALDRPLRLRSGDELEGVAAILDSLSGAVTRSREEQEQLARSYRRFVPERLLSLLGKQSIREVDKGTFATRRMAVMMVWFQFPEPVYSGSGNTRLLFDSINEIIERTASIAAGKGGTVFNFAYSGYDVVMDDCPALVSAAVAMAQEVLSFNSLRSREGLPTVSFRMALDVGDVLLGVVGDNTQMQPTAISTSFSAVKGLISLCGKLQANILCTEAVISGAGEYAYRYMGKCLQDDLPVRVYEIFSGDEYEVRRAKQATVRRFSQGVLALYSGETLQAKRIFLELAHQNSRDGGVRHYLYLADRLEKEPGRPCSLDG